jgi:uncharacterized membrane protein
MRRVIRSLCGPFFVAAGILHFVKPKMYVSIMPSWLPAHRELVYASGVAEIAGGAGLLAPSPLVRRWSSWWLVATLLAVFPANVGMARHHQRHRVPGGRWALLARLPFQGVFAWWALAAARR